MFSVIIATHNRPEFLSEAVASVVDQSFPDFEVLIIDDASTPPARVARSDPRIRVIRRERAAGPAASRNEGMRASRGRYLVFLDDDDLFVTGRLALGVEGVGTSTISVCAATTLDQRSRSWISTPLRALAGRNNRGKWKGESGSATQAQLFPQVGQVTILATAAPEFDERLRVEEDVDWWITASEGAMPKWVARPGYVRRIHDRPRVRSREDLTRVLESTRLVLEKNDSFFKHHPAAAAARWRRIGRFNERLGHRPQAREAFRKSAALAGAHARKADIFRTYLPIPAPLRTRI
jgi:glycosyltransferase involved in cell wall biosynthesis